jgi:hypothetical protein
MGIWMEVRCENRDTPSAYTGYDNECWSYQNHGAMEMADDSAASVLRILKIMEGQSIKGGWKKIKGKWYCPHCVPIIESVSVPKTSTVTNDNKEVI